MISQEEINDEYWCCVVVMLIENDVQFSSLIDQFEKSVSTSKDYPIVNIRGKDLGGGRTRKTTIARSSERRIISDETTIYHLKDRILKYKHDDLSKRRLELIQPSAGDSQESNMPKCGPFCYFVLTKIYDPKFMQEAIKAGIPLVAIFEIGDEISFVQGKESWQTQQAHQPSLKQSSRTQNNMLIRFWIELVETLGKPSNCELFSNTLLISINVNHISSLHVDENFKRRGDILFDQFKLYLFSLTKNIRNYIHYINNMKLFKVPALGERYKPKLDLYDNLLSSVPLECVTVELVLHCLVKQVVANVSPYKSEQVAGLTNIHGTTFDYLKDRSSLYKTLFINHKDRVLIGSYKLSNDVLNLAEIHSNLYSLMPYIRIWDIFSPQNETEKLLAANQLQKLQKCFSENLEKDRFINCLHLVFFNKMYNLISNLEDTRSLSEDHLSLSIPCMISMQSLLESSSAKTIKMSQIGKNEREIQLENLSKHLNCDEILDLDKFNEEEELFDYFYSENLSKPLMLQSLHRAFHKFNCIDYEYCRLTDSILMYFHNDCDERGMHNEFKNGTLCGPIGFRDFYIYHRIKESEWLNREKDKMSDIESELRKVYFEQQFSNQQSIKFNETKGEFQIPFPPKEFFNERSGGDPHVIGYLISDSSSLNRTCQETTCFYSVDGAVVTVEKYKWQKQQESLTLSLNSHGHSVHFHRNIEAIDGSQYSIDNESVLRNFLIRTKTGTIISCVLTKCTSKRMSFGSLTSAHSSIDLTVYPIDVSITLANGLMITFVRGELNYVKQKYLVPFDKCKNEEFRVFLQCGTVMVFMKSGSIVILYPNSSETRIKVLRKIIRYDPQGDDSSQDDTQESFQARRTTTSLGIADAEQEKKVIYEVYKHEVICPNGNYVRFRENQVVLKQHIYQLQAAVNMTKGLYTARTDGTKQFVDVDGLMTTSFPDGTIITSKPFLNIIYNTYDDPSIYSYTTFNSTTRKEGGGSVGEQSEDEVSDPFETYSIEYTMYSDNYMKLEYSSGKWTIHLPSGGKLISGFDSLEVDFDSNTTLKSMDETLEIITRNTNNPSKKSKTLIFLETSQLYDNAVCSIQDSRTRAFLVSKDGTTATFCGMNALAKRSSVFMGRADSTNCPLKRVDSRIDFQKSHQEIKSLYSSLFYKDIISRPSQHLIFFLSDENPLHSMNPFLRRNKRNKFFVVRRDLSGCEFIHEKDNKIALNKYEDSDQEMFTFFHSSTTKRNNITYSQRPLKTQSTEKDSSYDGILLSGIQKFELSGYLPLNKKWLFDLAGPKSSQGEDSRSSMPLFKGNQRTQPVFIIRRVFDNKQAIESIPQLFEDALRIYSRTNDDIIERYRGHVIPDCRTPDEITAANDTFQQSLNYIWNDARSYSLREFSTCDHEQSSSGIPETSHSANS